jgi:hypothetical protein
MMNNFDAPSFGAVQIQQISTGDGIGSLLNGLSQNRISAMPSMQVSPSYIPAA